MYRTKALRNAAQRRWRVANRVARYQQGLCRDCPRSRGRRVLCFVCYAKQYQRRPDLLDVLNARKRDLQLALYPAQSDRRRGGHGSAALAWALQMRQEAI